MITITDAAEADEFHIGHAGCRDFYAITTVNAGDFHTAASCPRIRSDRSDNPPITSPYQPALSMDGYDADSYDAAGYDADSYDAAGYDADGYDADGYDADGYDRNGLDNEGYTRDQTQDSADLDLTAEWAAFPGSRSLFTSRADAFQAHLRTIVRDPDAIDDLGFCGRCGDPGWDDDLRGARRGTIRICLSCWNDWSDCWSCDARFPDDDLTETLNESHVCNQCLGRYWSWCDNCEGYYSDDDADDHSHDDGSGCCDSPQPEFRIRNDGCEPLAAGTRFTVTLPADAISTEGLSAIRCYLQRSELWNLSDSLYKLGDQWQTRTGNFTKRLSRLAWTDHQVKLSPEVLSQVGCIARDHSTPVSTEIEVTRDLNQPAHYFYHKDSCWWQSYSESRCALKTNGGFGLRSFNRYGGVSGRAWVLPLRQDGNGHLVPTFETMTPDAFVVFNGYGNLSGYTGARIMAHLAGWTYRKIDFTCEPMYVNAGGYIIAPEVLAEKYTDTYLRLSVSQHSDLFYTEKRELVHA